MLFLFTFSAETSYAQETGTFSKIKGWLTPEQDMEGPLPSETLKAPFAKNTQNAGSQNALMTIYEAENGSGQSGDKDIRSLDNPHRNPEQIAVWANEAASESLNFSFSDLQTFGSVLRPYFSDRGMSDFKKFLGQADIVTIMRNNNKELTSYIESLPAITKKGVSDGKYKWIVEIPVMISYTDPEEKMNKAARNQSQKLLVTTQLSRTSNLKRHPEGIMIERWVAKANK
tara:strand:- start:104 stop:790 length:687 start_codon:yes stop_codon:yes gene_type:complete